MAYKLSPYLLAYIGRDSALLMPWAAVPWFVLLARRALRNGGWKDAAGFSAVVALVGGMNATTLMYAGVAPVLWLVYAAASRQARLRAVLVTAAKIGAGSLLVSLWWASGLYVAAFCGRGILHFTISPFHRVGGSSLPPRRGRHSNDWDHRSGRSRGG